MIELWKPVVGYEGIYEVSDMGRIRSLSRRVKCQTGSKVIRERILKFQTDRQGRQRVTLFRLGDCETLSIHKLVLCAFVGEPSFGEECCHWNGNASDNRLTNLRWDTRVANRVDAHRLGEIPLGEARAFAKLTANSVRQMRLANNSGRFIKDIAKEFGVSFSTAYKAIRRLKWKHVA